MERKKRNLMVVLIAAVIVVAILASFGLRLFVPDTAKIVLPTPAASASPGLEPGTGSGLVRVDVTPETVQTVIGQTLTRPESYFREVTIEDFWGDGEQSSTTARVWVDGGWTMTESAMADGAIRHTIVGRGSSGSGTTETAPRSPARLTTARRIWRASASPPMRTFSPGHGGHRRRRL